MSYEQTLYSLRPFPRAGVLLHFDNEEDIHELYKVWDKWLRAQFGYVNHLALIACFLFYEKGCKEKSIQIIHFYLKVDIILILNQTWPKRTGLYVLLVLDPLIINFRKLNSVFIQCPKIKLHSKICGNRVSIINVHLTKVIVETPQLPKQPFIGWWMSSSLY